MLLPGKALDVFPYRNHLKSNSKQIGIGKAEDRHYDLEKYADEVSWTMMKAMTTAAQLTSIK